MIKIALRRNLIYPLQLLIWKVARDILLIINAKLFNFKNSLVYTSLMFFAESLTGLIVYKYQERAVKKKQFQVNYKNTYSIELIQNETYLSHLHPIDKRSKIFLLIFCAALSDYIQFIIRSTIVPKFLKISATIHNRLGGFITLLGAFFYVYALKIPIFKHQIFALIIISFCLIIIMICEFIFQEINIFLSYTELLIVLLIILVNQIFDCLLDTIEKYLFEYDFANPFKVLMFEGIFGTLLSFFLFFVPSYTEDVPKVYKNNSSANFMLFIFLLFVFIIMTGFKNIFKLITTKLYSPMARAFTDYFINPIYLLYYFLFENDFVTERKLNRGLYFGINLLLSIIISFCGLVFNEFIVLFCCGLERNTHDQVSKRANSGIELGSEISDDMSENQ